MSAAAILFSQVDTIDFEKTVTDTTVVFDTEMDVAGERTIAEGQSLEWKAQVGAA
jgi:hypothetical protein